MLFSVNTVALSFKLENESNPPGTIKSNGIYIDKYEITVIDWKEFVQQMKADSNISLEYIAKIMPDTLVNKFYLGLHSKNEQLTPIKGITKFQALEFCKWRSEVVTFIWNTPELAPDCSRKGCTRPLSYTEVLEINDSATTIVTYRLPTNSELDKSTNRIRYRDKSLKLLTDEKIEFDDIYGLRCVAQVTKL